MSRSSGCLVGGCFLIFWVWLLFWAFPWRVGLSAVARYFALIPNAWCAGFGPAWVGRFLSSRVCLFGLLGGSRLLVFIKAYVNFGKPEINAKFDETVDKLDNKTHTMGIIEQVQQMKIEEGIEKTKMLFIKNLLQNSNHTLQEIAAFAEVSVDFVLGMKKQLESK